MNIHYEKSQLDAFYISFFHSRKTILIELCLTIRDLLMFYLSENPNVNLSCKKNSNVCTFITYLNIAEFMFLFINRNEMNIIIKTK